MLLRKLSFSEKVKRVIPERLESFATRSRDKEEDVGTLDLGFELVEDPLTLRSNEFGSETEIVDDEDRRELDLTTDRRVGKDISKQMSASILIAAEDKRSDLEFELSQEVINLERLQQISSTGLPDGGGLRSMAWKLLLGYLSTSRDLWEGQLADNRLKYAKLNEELLFNPSEIMRRKDETLVISGLEKNSASDVLLKRHDISQADHPLSVGKASIWNQYFQDSEIAEQIDRDLQRTHPDIKFFSADSSFSCKHQLAMRNILLLFAKLNPAIRYVQGMNEVLAPLYFVCSTDSDEQNSLNAEADSFACFVRFLSGSVDHFCQQLDNSAVGILCTLSRFMELLKANDEELWWHLEISNKVNPQFYAFRWITLLLTQEFKFATIMRIWDSLLSSPDGVQDMLLRVCCAMLLCVRSKLLNGDFAANLKLLQHYPESNIEYLLKVAQELNPILSTFLSPV